MLADPEVDVVEEFVAVRFLGCLANNVRITVVKGSNFVFGDWDKAELLAINRDRYVNMLFIISLLRSSINSDLLATIK